MFLKKKKPTSKWVFLSAGVISLAAAFSLGYIRALVAVESVYEARMEMAYDAGFQAGLQSQDYKDLALKDAKFSDRLCTTWWFALDHRERKIDLTGKPKRH